MVIHRRGAVPGSCAKKTDAWCCHCSSSGPDTEVSLFAGGKASERFFKNQAKLAVISNDPGIAPPVTVVSIFHYVSPLSLYLLFGFLCHPSTFQFSMELCGRVVSSNARPGPVDTVLNIIIEAASAIATTRNASLIKMIRAGPDISVSSSSVHPNCL